MNIYCIIPALNEEKTIAGVINGVKPFVSRVVVVDDCSADRTAELAAGQGAVVLRHIINRDQGAALRTGTEYALKNGAEIIVHFDGDGQFSAEEIKDVIAPITNGEADIVFGSRFLGKKSKMPRFKEKVLFPLARMVNYFVLGINTTDPQSGFRAMSKKTAEQIVIEHRGKAHCSEILHKAFKYNLRVKEVPMTVIYRRFGLKLSDGFRILKDLFLARLIN